MDVKYKWMFLGVLVLGIILAAWWINSQPDTASTKVLTETKIDQAVVELIGEHDKNLLEHETSVE